MPRVQWGPNVYGTCYDCGAPVQGRRQRCDEHWAANRHDQFKRSSAAYRSRKKELAARGDAIDLDELKDLLSAALGSIQEAGDERRDIELALEEVDEFLYQMYRILHADE